MNRVALGGVIIFQENYLIVFYGLYFTLDFWNNVIDMVIFEKRF